VSTLKVAVAGVLADVRVALLFERRSESQAGCAKHRLDQRAPHAAGAAGDGNLER